MKNKFFISIILLFFVSSCSISNPLKKKVKVTYLDCPKSLVLFPASKITTNNSNIEFLNDYSLNCYKINNQEIAEVSINYNIKLINFNEEIPEYQMKLLVFVTNKKEDLKLQEFTIVKDLKIEEKKQKSFNYNFNDKIQIKISDYENGIKLFLGII
tara:strand:+ start:103 stop:570 length:468 start_codon:yes stop_codon:yes gene_type:complete